MGADLEISDLGIFKDMRKFTHMARVISEYKLTGRFDDLQLYEMDGQVYARMVSTLDGKKVKTHPRFARTRIEYKRLAKASPIANRIYRQLPKETHIRGYFQAITGAVINLLKQGISPEQAYDIVLQAATSQHCVDTRTLAERAYYIAAAIYKQLPEHEQLIGYFEALQEQAMGLLRDGLTIQQAQALLQQAAIPSPQQQQKDKAPKENLPAIHDLSFAEHLLNVLFTDAPTEEDVQPCLVNDMPP